MPINTANDDVRKDLEALTHESWFDADSINKLFPTEDLKKQLSDLRQTLNASKQQNEAAADTWQKLGAIKDVALSLLKKSAGIPI